MQEAAGPAHSASAAALHAALLDYFGAPGKHQLVLRQPALLFASIREVLQIAAGRGVADTRPAPDAPTLREAAAFFLRAALLYPGADHYAVLGLAARREPVELKERYRLLMRLIHPDFAAADAPPWPADAAVRVNRAYEVLSSPVLRQEYDEQLAAVALQRPVHAPAADARRPAPPDDDDDDGLRINRKALWAGAAGLALLGILVVTPRPEPVALVQKPAATPAPAARSYLPEAAEPAPQLLASQDLRPQPVPAMQEPPASPPPSPPTPSSSPPLPSSWPPPQNSDLRGGTETPPTVAQAKAPPPRAAARPVAPAPVARAPAPPPAPARVIQAQAMPSRSQIQPGPAVAPAARTWVTVEASAPPTPPPMRVVEAAPQRVAAVEPPPAPPPPMAVPVAARPAPLPSPTLADAQPLLTQLLLMLETGSGEQLLRLLDGEARHAPSARALSRQYDQLVQGAAPIRLSQVEFRGEPRDGSLFVTGRVRLHRGEPTIGAMGDGLAIRAEFVSRAGKVTLKGLSSASD